jgi:hypothetical protein
LLFLILPIELEFDLWENRVLSYRYFRINVQGAGKENFSTEEVHGV